MLIHLTHDIRHLIKLSFNTQKSTRGLDALSHYSPSDEGILQLTGKHDKYLETIN
jgi:hypothetical protein